MKCRFQQASAYKTNLPGDSIRVVNAHGSCVSALNISAASLQAVNISAIAPEQWQNFTWANFSESLQHIQALKYLFFSSLLFSSLFSSCVFYVQGKYDDAELAGCSASCRNFLIQIPTLIDRTPR